MKLVSRSQPADTSRAEETRRRRVEAGNRRVTRAARNVISPVQRTAAAPGVVVRGTRSSTTPVHQKTRGKVRRQFYYSMGASGVEVRLPSIPLVRPGWRLLSALLVLVLAAGIYAAISLPFFQVESVQFEGFKRVSPEEVSNTLSLVNAPVFTVNPAEVTSTLTRLYPELKDIQVKASLPNKVAISAIERQPVIAWKVGDKTYWIDEEGFIFPQRGKSKGVIIVQSESVPPLRYDVEVLTGFGPATATPTPSPTPAEGEPQGDVYRKYIDPALMTALKQLAEAVPAGTVLVYSGKDGLGFADPAGWNVYVGQTLTDIDVKMKVYKAVVKKLEADGIVPVMISVANAHAPFYRLEQ